jgi:hypothetical protein
MTTIRIKDPDDRVDLEQGRFTGWVIAGVMLGLVVASTVHSGGLKERTAQGVAAAQLGHYDEAWQHLQLHPVKRYRQSERGCAGHSSGQVRQFLTRTPCRSLQRALLVVGTGTDTIAISVAWVQMPSSSAAAQLKPVLDKPGAGGIYPLPGQALKLGDIPFTGTHYSSRQSGALVVTAEAERVSGDPAAALLDAVTKVAVALPPTVTGPPATGQPNPNSAGAVVAPRR